MKVLSLLILLIISLPVRPQQITPAKERDLKLQRQRAQAVSMVEQIASEAPLWDEKQYAVEALADAADLLWEQSPARAARWLTKAWDLIEQVSEGQQNERLKEFVRKSQRSELQTIVLRVAHAHDVKLADKFIDQLTQKEPDEKKDRGAFDDKSARSEQFLRLAQQVVNTNPDLAFNLAQRSLADGVSFTLQNVLTSLRKKNVELSNRLFDLALSRIGKGLPDPSEAEVLAGYLFRPGVTFSSNSAGQVIMSMNPLLRNEPAVAQSEPQRAREFLVIAYQAFFTQPISLETPETKQRAHKIWVFGTRNAGRYDTLAPEFALPTKAYLTQLQNQLFPNGRSDPFSNRQTDAKNETTTKPLSEKDLHEARIAEMEDRADKETDPIKKRLAYVEATLAVDAQDYQRAKGIAEKIADDGLRTDTIAFVLFRGALAFVHDEQLEKATELAPQIGDLSRRAVVKIAIAQSLLAGKPDDKREPMELKVDQQRAFDLLNDVERDLRKEDPSSNAGRILLGRAALLAKLDKDQALIALEQAVQTINKLERFELKDGSAPRLGLSVSPRSESLVDTPRIGFNFRSAIDSLITSEFENIADVAGRLRIREVRGIGRLEVAKLYLQKSK